MRSMGYLSLIVSFVPRPLARADTVLRLGNAILFNIFKMLGVESSSQPTRYMIVWLLQL